MNFGGRDDQIDFWKENCKDLREHVAINRSLKTNTEPKGVSNILRTQLPPVKMCSMLSK